MNKRKYYKTPHVRYYNHKKYTLADRKLHKLKSKANKHALSLRRRGKYFARVAKVLGGYAVYVRKRGKW
tara:strand:+ start:583 stop:789 length:207 start_codon:yes stop_codon:yes gene_type:complete